MSLPFTVVDAFTDKPFGGNPAAVIILPSDHTYSDVTLQGIALEFNLSETAFVSVGQYDSNPTDGNYVSYGLRWFTPAEEVVLCGHATVAAATVLYANTDLVPENVNEIRFSTLSGILMARRVSGSSKIELEFPVGNIVPVDESFSLKATDMIKKAANKQDLGVIFVGVCDVLPYKRYILIEIDSKVDLASVSINANLLSAENPTHPITVVTNQVSNEGGIGFNVRVFASLLGIQEDPVTGSASSFAAKYWATKANVGPGQVVKVRQVSARGGDLDVIWEEQSGTAKIRGNARVASRGEIYL